MANTPIPSRAVEYSSRGTNKPREYTLTPEELEEIRQKYPATKADKNFKKPVAHNPRTDQRHQNKEEGKDMVKFKMTAEEYFAERQTGKSLEKIAEEHGVTPQAIDYHLKKWGTDGKQVEPDKTQLLREKEVLASEQRPSTDLEQLNKAVQEIERLTLEVTAKDEVKQVLQRRLDSTESEAQQWKARTADALASRDAAENELVSLVEERDDLRDEMNRMITERDELVAERDELYREKTGWIENEKMLNQLVEDLRDDIRRLREIQTLAVEPVSETQLLDRSIADLTRARKIIKLLSASGE